MPINVVPAGHKVLVLQDKLAETDPLFKNSIIIAPETDTMKREQLAVDTGTIVAIGMTAWKDHSEGKPWAAVGDRIVFAKYNGKAVKGIDSELHLLINDDDVLAVIGEDIHV